MARPMRRPRLRPLILAAGLALGLGAGLPPLGLPARAEAPQTATLVADSLEITGADTLVASGHIVIFYRGQRLTATRLIYDRATDRLIIEGPILMDDGQGVVVTATQADLKADLTEGILLSARMVLQDQLQISADQMTRASGRFTTLTRVAASSCKVCEGNPTPLWEVRAARVLHDQTERQLYFDHAQLRLAGLPIFYIPRLRMPDPTLHRTTGFLMPHVTNSTKIGTGLWLPYFMTLGPSRDLTVTPFLSVGGSRTVALRYREAFRTGRLEATLQASRDDIRPDQLRGYLTARGEFALPAGYRLALDLQGVSDEGYLLDYGLPEADRLLSRVEISRAKRNEYILSRVIGVQTLREGENNSTIPSVLGDLEWHRRFPLGPFGGQGGLSFRLHSHARTSHDLTDGDGDGISGGRDVTWGSIRADWRRDWVLTNGMVAAVVGQTQADLYRIAEDAAEAGTSARLAGSVAAELRWPWVRAASRPGGAAQVIEPVVQLVLSGHQQTGIPNEDSVLVEFDEGNLFALNRYPGNDAVEGGIRANLGLTWLRDDPAGWTLSLAAGRVLRAEATDLFSESSGLGGAASDWLLAWQMSTQSGLSLTNRLVIDDGFDLTRGEIRAGYTGGRVALSGGYVYLQADAAEGRTLPTEELVFDGTTQLARGWSARLSTRYDLHEDRASRAGAGLAFRNECLALDLSLSRRLTSSTSVTPTTEFGLSVELLGFGGSAGPGLAAQCRG